MSIRVQSKKFPWYVGVLIPRPLIIQDKQIFDLRLYDAATLEDCGDDFARTVSFPNNIIPDSNDLTEIVDKHINELSLTK